MLNKGDKIICKCDNTIRHNGYKQPLTINNVYKITNTSLNFGSLTSSPRVDYTILGDNNHYTLMTEDVNHFYIWDYFYSIDEWREKQINSLNL